MLTTIREIHIRSLRSIAPILTSYLNLNERLTIDWAKEQTFPWWFNERASMSILAGAIWKVGGVAFEEFSDEKSFVKKYGRRKKYRGRTDLSFSHGRHKFVAEAKICFVDALPKRYDPRKKILESLQEASQDVSKVRPYGAQRVGIVFVSPRFPICSETQLGGYIKDWINVLRKIPYSAAAWTFPAGARTTSQWNKWRMFPGTAIVVKKVD